MRNGASPCRARQVLNLAFYRRDVEFSTPYSKSRAIARLDGAVASSFSIFHAGVVGSANARRVSLRRNIPFVGNSFAPRFVGRFEEAATGSLLRGTFRLSWPSRIFAGYGLVFCIAWTIIVTFDVFREATTPLWFPLIGLVMLAVFAAMVALGRWFARNDEAAITREVEHILQSRNSTRAEPLK